MKLPDLFPWDELDEVIKVAREAEAKAKAAGVKPAADVAVAVAEWLMGVIDWRLVFPGPIGLALEAADDMAPRLVLGIARFIVKAAPFRRKPKPDA